jgi:hypothetical protein
MVKMGIKIVLGVHIFFLIGYIFKYIVLGEIIIYRNPTDAANSINE